MEEDGTDFARTEIWRRLVNEQVAKRVGRSLPEIEIIVKKIINELGIESLALWSVVPDHILLRNGTPAAFNQFVRDELKRGEATPVSEVELFFWEHGFDGGLNAAQIRQITKTLVKDHWLETMASLRSVPSSQWGKFEFADPVVIKKILTLIERSECINLMNTPSISLLDLFRALSSRLGKSPEVMQKLYEKCEMEGISTLEQFQACSEIKRTALGLPARLMIELNQLRSAEATPTRPSGDFGPFASPATMTSDVDDYQDNVDMDYEEPDVSTFLVRVGKAKKHSDSETRVGIEVLVNKHWLSNLTQLRELNDSDWNEMYLSGTFVQDMREGLVDPMILGMDAVHYSEPGAELFGCDVDVAIDELMSELPESEHIDMVKAFLRLLEILLLVPHDASKRSIRKSNAYFRRRVKGYKSVDLFLNSLGYVDYETHYLLPVLYMKRMLRAHLRFAQIAKKKEHSPSNGSIFDSLFGRSAIFINGISTFIGGGNGGT